MDYDQAKVAAADEPRPMNQARVGQAEAGYSNRNRLGSTIGLQAGAPRDRVTIGEIQGRLSDLVGRAGVVAQQANAIADGLLGPQPQPQQAGRGPGDKVAPGFLENVAAALDMISDQLADAERAHLSVMERF